MHTGIKDWVIVSIVENGEELGKILWGICVIDPTGRFDTGNYICTSRIKEHLQSESLITTNSGSVYQLHSDGSEVSMELKNLPLLRKGFSPDEIKLMNMTTLAH